MQASCDLAKSSVGNSEEPRQHLRAERADPKNLALTYHLWCPSGRPSKERLNEP